MADRLNTVFLGVPNYREVLEPGYQILTGGGFDLIENFDPLLHSVVSATDRLSEIELAVSGLEIWDAEAMDACSNLKGIVKSGTGVDNIDLEAARSRGIVVANTAGLNSNAVAELAVGYMLAGLRALAVARESVTGDGPRPPLGRELSGKTIGIVGLGAIGRRVAKLLSGFEPHILGYDPVAGSEIEGVTRASFEEVLRNADVITLHAPATAQTENMINASTLATMKPGAVLVNTARGRLIDEAALIEALDSGALFGVALDVFTVEPPSPDNPLLSHPRVFCTNHIGAATAESDHKVAIATAEGIVAIAEGREPANRIV